MYPPAGSQGPGAGGSGSGSVPWGGPFPSLHLWPIQDTFQMKMIYLPEAQRIKIGRQTNNKTVPGERNAYFDSKVLSRTHAEIWEYHGKIFIKDVKSSNGTFINGERLSAEGVESEAFELKSEDVVEFGIDIVSEDNRTIVHHKVAAKVYCVLGPEDSALSARELVLYQNHDARNQRRVNGNGQQAPMNSMAQVGPPVMSSGGKPSGLTFMHVLAKLEAELNQSKDAGNQLRDLTSTMTDIQDTLGGGLPPAQNGSADHLIPPQFRSASAEAQAALAGPHGQQAAAFISLQNQLTDTQSSLNGHLDKVRHLEDQVKEHETVRSEIAALREQMEQGKREMDLLLANARGRQLSRSFPDDVDEDDDDDDAKSTITLMGDGEGHRRSRHFSNGSHEEKVDRPDTPEPMANGDASHDHSPIKANGHDHGVKQHSELEQRIQALSSEISETVLLSRTLQVQHGEAMSAVKSLTERVSSLESGLTSRVTEELNKAEQRWDSWRVKFEDGWRKERESWNAERERLRGVVREWEEASRRAHEEEEERELNESLSEDEFEGDEDNVGGENGRGEILDIPDIGEWKEGTVLEVSSPSLPFPSPSSSSPSRPRSKRRRPSHRAILAVNALKAVAGENGETGSSTPRAELGALNDIPGEEGRVGMLRRGKGRLGKVSEGLKRTGSSRTFKAGHGDKESSESGKESSADTLKDGDEVTEGGKGEGKRGLKDKGRVQIPIFTVLVVAVVAGAIYYRQKD